MLVQTEGISLDLHLLLLNANHLLLPVYPESLERVLIKTVILLLNAELSQVLHIGDLHSSIAAGKCAVLRVFRAR